MNLLDEWQSKKSWKESYPFYFLYRGKNSGFSDLSLRNVCKKEGNIELDLESHSGFKDIELSLCPYQIERFKYMDVLKIQKMTLNEICNILNNLIKDYFKKVWNPKIFHLIYSSGGHDSRIIMGILKEMESEGFDLGEYLFLCHEDLNENEQILFKKSMKQFGYDKSKYEIYNEGKGKNEDYFWFDDFSVDYNFFMGPLINHYDPIKINPLKTCLVTGNHIRTFSQINFTRDYYINTKGFKKFSRDLIKWKDIISPFTYYEFLNYIRWIPPKFYGFKESIWFDLIRTQMSNLLGNNLPFHVGHKYNLNFSPETKKRITNDYYTSKFYSEFKIDAKFETCLGDKYIIDAKLYSLATVYEGVK